MFLNNKKLLNKTKWESKYLETNESKNLKEDKVNSGCSKCSAKRNFHMHMSLSQETREAASKQLYLKPKQLEKKKSNNNKNSKE